MKNLKVKVLENIAKISKKTATSAEGRQSMFLSYEPKKSDKKEMEYRYQWQKCFSLKILMKEWVAMCFKRKIERGDSVGSIKY